MDDKTGTRGKVLVMRASHLEDYYAFLRFPSISTDDAFADKLAECAHWLVKKLTDIGLEAKLMPTPGHPVVWAKNKHLPGIPSANEIQKNGLLIGDTQTKMMQKIEELTLYIIDQQKKYDALIKLVNEIKNTTK